MATLVEDTRRAVIELHEETKKEWISLKEIYQKVEEIRKEPNVNNGASIRAALETHCKSLDAFRGEELYILKEKGSGLYKSIYYDAINIIDGNYDVLSKYDDELAQKIYRLLMDSGYKPKVIIEYDRAAYITNTTTRITFDYNIKKR